jgi:NADPH-dependent 2,4-dienoyl-CoA reductase/sulfur reductase-like enzyme
MLAGNPTPSGKYNLVVIGAGTAGLVTAAGAAGLGAKVALIHHRASFTLPQRFGNALAGWLIW